MNIWFFSSYLSWFDWYFTNTHTLFIQPRQYQNAHYYTINVDTKAYTTTNNNNKNNKVSCLLCQSKREESLYESFFFFCMIILLYILSGGPVCQWCLCILSTKKNHISICTCMWERSRERQQYEKKDYKHIDQLTQRRRK